MDRDATGNVPAHQGATGRNNENRVLATLNLSRDGSRRFSEKQLAALEMLLRGCGDAEVAEALQVDRGTVYRWRTAHPTVRGELERLRLVVWEQQAERLRAMVRPALDVLQRQLDDPRTALRAATALLRLGAPRAKPLPEPPDPRRQQRDARRDFNRALDAYINAPMPDGTVGPRVSIDDDDDDDDDDDVGAG
jgi:hypothetical protein